MTPFHFGTGKRVLFGLYEPPLIGRGRARAAIICNPWGGEYIHAHRALRSLASRLTEIGFHTLRFDYFGTGDSAGDGCDGDLEGWQSDIQTAIAELSNMLDGNIQLTLIGLRLGALLAAAAGGGCSDLLSSIVLWDPVSDGKGYVSELHDEARSAGAFRERSLEAGGGHEICGFTLSSKAEEQLTKATFGSSLGQRTMIVWSDQDLYADHAIQLPHCRHEIMNCMRPWANPWPHIGAVPTETIQRIATWLL